MKIWTMVLAVLAIGVLQAGDANEVKSDLGWSPLRKKAKVEMADGSVTVDAKQVPAQTFVFSKGESSFSDALIISLPVSLREYPNISFRVKLEVPSGAPEDFNIAVLNEKNWYLADGPHQSVTKFQANAQGTSAGEYDFIWHGANLFNRLNIDEARFLALMYPVQQIPDGGTVKITISEVTFGK